VQPIAVENILNPLRLLPVFCLIVGVMALGSACQREIVVIAPTPEPLPTYTPYPTPTPLPTYTPYPTWTPQPPASPTPVTATQAGPSHQSQENWHFESFWRTADLSDVAELIDRGADVNARNEHGQTPLHLAAYRSEDPEIFALLLDRGADLHAREPGTGAMPLHRAAQSANPAVVELLLDRGLDVTTKDRSGRRACHFASDNPLLDGTDILRRMCP